MNFEGFIRFESDRGDILAKMIKNSQILNFSKKIQLLGKSPIHEIRLWKAIEITFPAM